MNNNHSIKWRKKITCSKVFPKKCIDKEAPVATFVANAFLPLDTAELDRVLVEKNLSSSCQLLELPVRLSCSRQI